jgi:hypothetical protein
MVFAAHLCRCDLRVSAGAVDRANVSAQAPTDDNACEAHCSHPGDGNQQGRAAGVAALAQIEQPAWNAVIDIRGAAAKLHSNPTRHRRLA